MQRTVRVTTAPTVSLLAPRPELLELVKASFREDLRRMSEYCEQFPEDSIYGSECVRRLQLICDFLDSGEAHLETNSEVAHRYTTELESLEVPMPEFDPKAVGYAVISKAGKIPEYLRTQRKMLESNLKNARHEDISVADALTEVITFLDSDLTEVEVSALAGYIYNHWPVKFYLPESNYTPAAQEAAVLRELRTECGLTVSGVKGFLVYRMECEQAPISEHFEFQVYSALCHAPLNEQVETMQLLIDCLGVEIERWNRTEAEIYIASIRKGIEHLKLAPQNVALKLISQMKEVAEQAVSQALEVGLRMKSGMRTGDPLWEKYENEQTGYSFDLENFNGDIVKMMVEVQSLLPVFHKTFANLSEQAKRSQNGAYARPIR